MKKAEITELLQKPVAMMTGSELFELVKTCVDSIAINGANSITTQPKKFVYGLKGIAEVFGCSVPTANRIKASGIIDAAITQIGRKIVVDATTALELVAKKKGENTNL